MSSSSGEDEESVMVRDRRDAAYCGSQRQRCAERVACAAILCWAIAATVFAVLGRTSNSNGLYDLYDGRLRSGKYIDLTSNSKGLYDLYDGRLRSAKYIDLTHAFSPRSAVWPGFGPPTFSAAKAGTTMVDYILQGQDFTYQDHGFEAGAYVLTTDQFGTQLDPPAHWNEFGATISDVPATVAVRPLVVIDIHSKVADNLTYHASVQDARDWESRHGRIPEGSVVMIRSDWSKGWDLYSKKGAPAKFPGVELNLLKFLHNERQILFHGHEPLDTDMTPSLEGEAWLLHKNFLQAEGVANLDQVPEIGCLISIGFAKASGGLGGLARYVAICPESSQFGLTIDKASGSPLPEYKDPLRRDSKGVMVPTKGATPTTYCKAGSKAFGCSPQGAVWNDTRVISA